MREREGRWEDAVRDYECVIAGAGGRPELLVAGIERLACCYGRYGDARRAASWCLAVRDRLPPELSAARAVISARAAGLMILTGQRGRAAQRGLTGAWVQAELSGDPHAVSVCRTIRGLCVDLPMGRFDNATDAFAMAGAEPEARRHLLTLQRLVGVVRGRPEPGADLPVSSQGRSFVDQAERLTAAMAAVSENRPEAAKEWLRAMARGPLPAQIGPWYFRTRCLAALLSGDLHAAEGAAEEMDRTFRRMGAGLYAPECAHAMALLLMRRDRRGQAERVLRASLAACARVGFAFWEMKGWMQLAACATTGRGRLPPPALEALARALRLVRRPGFSDVWRSDPFGVVESLLECACRERELREDAERLLGAHGVADGPLLEVRTFGGLTLRRRDGSSLALPAGQRRLLCVLAENTGRAISAASLAALLWPDEDGGGADRVRTLVKRLRDRLGSSVIRHRPEGYDLDARMVWLDWREFCALADRGDENRKRGENEAAARCYREALALYRGLYLDGEDVDDTMQSTQAWLEGRFREVGERLDGGGLR